MATPIQVIKNLTCFNQAETFQFWCVLSWRHMSIKSALQDTENNAISEKLHDFDRFSIEKITESFATNINYLMEYFSLTRSEAAPPRVSIKVPVGVGEDQGLLEIAKSSGMNSERIHKTSENTGFDFVTKNGKYYINNDIPLSTKLGQYKNPRLDTEIISKLNADNFDEWCQCWTDDGGGKPSCYKSTLIVPMTLVNSKLLPEFRERFIPDQDVTRTIFGFLCFDHVDKDYFNDEDDVNVGYIAADWMSLYLMALCNYTTNSESYKKLTELHI